MQSASSSQRMRDQSSVVANQHDLYGNTKLLIKPSLGSWHGGRVARNSGGPKARNENLGAKRGAPLHPNPP